MNRKFEGGLQVLALASAAVLASLWPMSDARSSAEEVAQPIQAQPSETQVAGSATRGRVSYRLYCASCHGQAAQGDGPVAAYLKTPPVDLTTLAAKNGGKFPAEQVIASIDGREIAAVPSHGPRDMPVWGMSFQDPAKDTNQEEDARRKIADLVAFLEGLQK